MLQAGYQKAGVSSLLGITPATLARHWLTYKKFGIIKYLPRFTRLICLLSKEHRWAIQQWITQDAQLALANVRVMLEVAFQIEVSTSTVYRAIRKMNFTWKKMGISPFN